MRLDPPPLPSERIAPHMMRCPDCRAVISKRANACPQCGRQIGMSPAMSVVRVVIWLCIISGAIAFINNLP